MATKKAPGKDAPDVNIGKLIAQNLSDQIQQSYLDYAMSVIVSRALPDVRDGMKPVARRILYSMWTQGLRSSAKFRKSAHVVGDVLGKYHPHNDVAVYDALARLTQDFSMRYPLIAGQGNWGSIDGDSPAAMRYTETKLDKIADEIMLDLDKQTVDLADNYDGTRHEPTVLPGRLPQLLVNGTLGIAVGMATNIPPHNLNEVCDASIYLIDHPKAAPEDLVKFVKGPDFPTGAAIYDKKEILRAYATGKGSIVMRALVDIENEEGYVELSLRSATRERSWDELRRKLENGDIFETEILDANKGGLIARVNGVMGFIPVSQLAPDHYPRVEGGDKSQILERLKEYVGQKFKVKVITASQDEEKLIVSEKAAVGDELSETLMKLNKGATVSGLVSGIADFGVFVKFAVENQELEGLVHISELAWQRIDNPSDIVQVGEKVEAKVIGVDGLRISLSIKQLREDPWSTVKDRYKVGDTIQGEILKVTAFGGFVKLDKDIHGLVHVSELPKEAQANPSSILTPGEKYSFKIISLEPSEHRLGLSLGGNEEKKVIEAKSEQTSEETPEEASTVETKEKKEKPAKKKAASKKKTSTKKKTAKKK